ncbi:ribonuclease H-like domain-containing protein [Aspergillus crustosus]
MVPGPRGTGVDKLAILSVKGSKMHVDMRKTSSNGAVEEKENAFDDLLRTNASYVTDVSLPIRPCYGSRGVPVVLYANYFQLSTPTACEVYRYNVEIVQCNVSLRRQRQLINLLLIEHFAEKRDLIATDFRSTLISLVDLIQGTQEAEYDVRYKEDTTQNHYPDKASVFRVKVTSTGPISISSLIDYLSSTTNLCTIFRSKPETLQALDIIVNHHAQSNPSLESTPTNSHFPIQGPQTARFTLGAGLEALRGFSIAVRAATSRLLVNCQVDYAVFCQNAELTRVIAAFRQDSSPNVSRLEAFLRRLQVRVTHLHHQSRVRVIAGLAAPADGEGGENPPIVECYGAGPREVQFWFCYPAPAVPGKMDGRTGTELLGRYITVEAFFREKYGIAVDPDMPVIRILSRRKQPIYLPVDVCVIRDGQPARSRIGAAQRTRMKHFAIRSPAVNARSVATTGAELVAGSTILKKFGFTINPNLVTVPGRVLQPPSILYSNQTKAKVTSACWKQNSARFCKPCRLSTWAFLYIVGAKDKERECFRSPEDLKPCIGAFRSKLHALGVVTQTMADGHRVDVSPAFSHGRYNMARLDSVIGSAVAHLARVRKPELVLVILSSNNRDIYGSVKRVCDVHLGIRNICTLASKFVRRDEACLASLALKLNLKMGGVNHVLAAEKEKPGILAEGRTMIVGIEISHPAAATAASGAAQPTIVSMVASVDKHLAQWPADIQITYAPNPPPLDRMLETRLYLWARRNNNTYPENIIIYRSGLPTDPQSASPSLATTTTELPLLKSACATCTRTQNKPMPRLTYILVSKRHKTRLYPSRPGDADLLSNPRNGTVVDRGVTEARQWDFYLQAHAPLAGTARPAHYVVWFDEVFRGVQVQQQQHLLPNGYSNGNTNPANSLEEFTHELCYLFGRTNKAISICTPAYYAGLLCERGRCYLVDGDDGGVRIGNQERNPGVMDISIHADLRETMFYI